MTLRSVVIKEVDFPWSTTGPRRTMQLEPSQILSENEGSINWPTNSATMYIVTGGANDLGEKRGYRVMPGSGIGSPIHLTTIDPSSLMKSAEWAKYDFFRYEAEGYGTTIYISIEWADSGRILDTIWSIPQQ